MKPQPTRKHLQFGGVFVADRQPKRPIGSKSSMDAGDPSLTKLEVFVGSPSIIVDVVVITDVERRIGKDQVDAAGGQSLQIFDAVARDDLIDGGLSVQGGGELAKGAAA